MAGGIFTSQNKVRPGAYINFKAISRPYMSIGSRGIVTMALPMSWGAEEELVEVLSTDILDGKCLPKIGYYGTDSEAQIIREALRNSHTVLLFRLKANNAVSATGTDNNLTVVAKYTGIVGNQLKVSVEAKGSDFEVKTFLRNELVDTQIAKVVEELKENAYVRFNGTGALQATAGFPLENGADGTVQDSAYTRYFDKIKTRKFNTMGLPFVTTEPLKENALAVVKDLRENKGRKVQVVLDDYIKGNYEGVISTAGQGYATEVEEVSKEAFVAYVAGLTAGTEVNISNTYHEIVGAVRIINELTDEQIEDSLIAGKIVLSYRIDEAVVIERDINTLTSYSEDTNEVFSKNRVIRTLDEINNTVSTTYQANYIGKVNNDDAGRASFKADVISYLTSLQTIGAIKDFNSQDVEVLQGDSIDSVVCNLAITPNDAMEKLYMTVTIN